MGFFDILTIFVSLFFFTLGLLFIIFARKIGEASYIPMWKSINIFVLIERLLNKWRGSEPNEYAVPGLSVCVWCIRIWGFWAIGIVTVFTILAFVGD